MKMTNMDMEEWDKLTNIKKYWREAEHEDQPLRFKGQSVTICGFLKTPITFRKYKNSVHVRMAEHVDMVDVCKKGDVWVYMDEKLSLDETRELGQWLIDNAQYGFKGRDY